MLLRCREVTRVFGTGRRRRVALDRVSFTADTGEVLGIIGPNGAGKTTLLRLIAGDLPLTAGEITVAGERAGTIAARRAVGYAPDPPLAPPELTGLEWLTYLASHRAAAPAERLRVVRAAVEFAELEEFVGRRIAQYSRGMGQRLAVAGAAVLQGRVMVLDEVLTGIDPLVQRRLRHRLARLAADSTLVLVASHDLGAVERLATRVLVVWEGRVAADVATSALLAERVAEIAFTGSGLAAAARLLDRFAGAVRTGQGIAVPLSEGLTIEGVLAVCRDERLPVAASRVRYRALEDVLVAAAEARVRDVG